MGETWRRARFAPGLVPYLRSPLAPGEALAAVSDRLASREERFLDVAGRAIFDDPGSPHRRLLRSAGWDLPRLRSSIRRDGLDATLGALRDDGVRTSQDELRDSQASFRNILVRGRGLAGETSGSSGRPPGRVAYGWPFLREEAALECLLLASHDLLDTPCAFWLPGPPAVSGTHNLLVHLGFGRPPERWFSQLAVAVRDRAVLRGVAAAARPFGSACPGSSTRRRTKRRESRAGWPRPAGC